MRQTRAKGKEFAPSWLSHFVGYTLFVASVIFAVSRAPAELWDVKPHWLLGAVIPAGILFLLQTMHVIIFLRYHGRKPDKLDVACFVAQKGILNVFLPLKGGTIVLLHPFLKKSNLKWKMYASYLLLSSFLSLFTGLVAFFAINRFIIMVVLCLVLCLAAVSLLALTGRKKIVTLTVKLLLYSAGMLISLILGMRFILEGLGVEGAWYQTGMLGITLNTLAQISITPANMGVREIVLGTVSPYIEQHISVGILSGALMLTVRIMTYGLIQLGLMVCINIRHGKRKTGRYYREIS